MTPETAIATLADCMTDPDRKAGILDLITVLVAKDNKLVVNKLLTEQDIAARLQVSLPVAKKILEKNADVQAGRKWRMTENKFQECIRNRRFSTSY